MVYHSQGLFLSTSYNFSIEEKGKNTQCEMSFLSCDKCHKVRKVSLQRVAGYTIMKKVFRELLVDLKKEDCL